MNYGTFIRPGRESDQTPVKNQRSGLGARSARPNFVAEFLKNTSSQKMHYLLILKTGNIIFRFLRFRFILIVMDSTMHFDFIH